MSAETIPDRWCWVPLRELVGDDAPIVYGIIQAGPEIDGGIPYIRPTELADGGIDIPSLKRTSKEIAGRYERSSLKAGDIVLAIVGTIGKLAIVPPELEGANITQSSARVRPPVFMPPSYLAAVLSSPQLRRQFDEMEFGLGVRRLNVGHVRSLMVPVAPFNEQRRIVAKLEALQGRSRKAREALDEVPALLEKLRQSILAAAFRGDLTKDWRAKNPDVEPAEKLLQRIRVERRKKWEEAELAKMKAKGKAPGDDRWKTKYEDPAPVDTTGLPELPPGWCWTSVELLTERVTKGSSPNWQGFEYTNEGIPFVRSQNVGWGVLALEELAFLPASFNEKEPRSILRAGDVLLNIVGASIGRAAQATSAVQGGNVNQAVAVIRPAHADASLGEFLLYWFLSPFAQSRIHSDKVDVARANLSLEDIARMQVPLPPIDELIITVGLISRILPTLMRGEQEHEGLKTTLIDLEKALLAKAFRGELVPQDPNDEPAAAMLARLKAASTTAADSDPSSASTGAKRGRKGRPPKNP